MSATRTVRLLAGLLILLASLALALLLVIVIGGPPLFIGCGDDDGPTQPPPPECDIAVAVPNGGEVWTVGDSVDVIWTANSSCGDFVRLDLLQDGGLCTVVGDSISNDGSHRWQAEAFVKRGVDKGLSTFDEDVSFSVTYFPQVFNLRARQALVEFI